MPIEDYARFLNTAAAYTGLGTWRQFASELRKVAAGGNFRYRSRNIAGYYRSPLADGSSPEGEIDPQRPIAGEPYWDAGAMLSYSFKLAQTTTVRLQLNVENLFGFADRRLVRVDSDTDGLFGAKYAYAPLTRELRRPRNYRLTATFGF